jgi:hypothetical protein
MSMGASSFTSGGIGEGAAVGGWAATLVLTFLLIGLPTIYLLVVIHAADDDAFDRTASDIDEHVKVNRRTQAYAPGRDVYPVSSDRPLGDAAQSSQKRQSRLEEDEHEIHAADPLRRRRLGTLQPSR